MSYFHDVADHHWQFELLIVRELDSEYIHTVEYIQRTWILCSGKALWAKRGTKTPTQRSKGTTCYPPADPTTKEEPGFGFLATAQNLVVIGSFLKSRFSVTLEGQTTHRQLPIGIQSGCIFPFTQSSIWNKFNSGPVGLYSTRSTVNLHLRYQWVPFVFPH